MEIQTIKNLKKVDREQTEKFISKIQDIRGSVLIVSRNNFFQQTILPEVLNKKNDCLVEVVDFSMLTPQKIGKYDNVICADPDFLTGVRDDAIDISDFVKLKKSGEIEKILEFNKVCFEYFVGIENVAKFFEETDKLDLSEILERGKDKKGMVVFLDGYLQSAMQFLEHSLKGVGGLSLITKSKSDFLENDSLILPEDSDVIFLIGEDEDVDKKILATIEGTKNRLNILRLPGIDSVTSNLACMLVFAKIYLGLGEI